MTAEELEREKTPAKPKTSGNKKTGSKKNTAKPKVVFAAPYAQMGEARITLIGKYEGEEIVYKNKKLINGKFEIPKNITPNQGEKPGKEYVKMRSILQQNGFVDVTKTKGGKIDKVKNKYIYKAVHPEQTDNNNINGKISMVLKDDQGQNLFYKSGKNKGKQITKEVTLINGVAVTDDADVYQALIRSGFYEIGKTVKE